MSIYVDDMRPVQTRPTWFSLIRQRKWRYPEHCHMMADSDKELEEMARLCRLPNQWRHGNHYDLTANKRRLAIARGAIVISTREMVSFRKSRRDSVEQCLKKGKKQ